MDYKLKEAGMLEELCSVGIESPTEKGAMLDCRKKGEVKATIGVLNPRPVVCRFTETDSATESESTYSFLQRFS
jgi:hypothetical protein